MDENLTELANEYNHSDPAIRNKAANGIAKWLLSTPLLKRIERELADDVRPRVDAEDVAQSALHSFFGRKDLSFENRHAMYGYIIKVAVNKTRNLNKYHHAEKRNAGLDEQEDVLQDGSYAVDRRDHKKGWKPVPEIGAEPTSNAEITHSWSYDTFFDDTPLELIAYGGHPLCPTIFDEMLIILKEHDNREDDILNDITMMMIDGHKNSEIAKKFETTKRTIERKLNLIKRLLNETKSVSVEYDEKWLSDEKLEATLVSPVDTAKSFLKKLEIDEGRLHRVIDAKPEPPFDENARVFDHVADGDVLRVTPR